MRAVIGRVIARDQTTTTVEINSSCGGCNGCQTERSTQLVLPGVYDQQVELRLGLKDQFLILFNSLGLPLLAMLVAALIAEQTQLGEGAGIILAVCGFTLGVALCREIKNSAVKIRG